MKVVNSTGMVHLTSILLLTILQSASLACVDGFAPVVVSPLINHRGGATTLPSNQPHAHTADSDGSSDSDVEVEVEVDLVTSKFANVAANNARQMSNSGLSEIDRQQQSKSLLLSAVLWSSLALDTVLNKKKRCQIFPGLEAAGNGGALIFQFGQRNVNLASTAMMTSGFLLSAGLAGFLSTDYKREDSADDTGVRKKLSLLLFSFGMINLCANISPARAPFYGMGGFIINAHNALIALNGWIKEMRADSPYSNSSEEDKEPTMKDFGNTIKSIISPISRPIGVSSSGMGTMTASLMRVCGIIAFMRAFGVVANYLLPHYKSCIASKSFASIQLEQLQLIGLQWASLSRIVLAGGACLALKDEVDNGLSKGRVAKSLGVILSICALFAGIPSVISGSAEHLSNGFKLVMFGLITGMSNILN